MPPWIRRSRFFGDVLMLWCMTAVFVIATIVDWLEHLPQPPQTEMVWISGAALAFNVLVLGLMWLEHRFMPPW